MDKKVSENIKIEGAQLIFKNFSGKGSQYNDEGKRNFGVLLDPESAEALAADGWNVKFLKPRDDAEVDDPQAWLKVNVKFGKIPPIINLITARGRVKIDKDTVDQIDWVRIKNVDLIIRPYNYPEMPGRPAGVSAYLKSLYVTVDEDDLEKKYGSIPMVGDEEDTYVFAD